MNLAAQKKYLQALSDQAKVLYMDYIKKMKALDQRAQKLLEQLEKKKLATLRGKINKI